VCGVGGARVARSRKQMQHEQGGGVGPGHRAGGGRYMQNVSGNDNARMFIFVAQVQDL